jgi:membrane-associated phospholipid phosphatase
LSATTSGFSTSGTVRGSHGPIRIPLLAIALVALAGFALDAFSVLGQPVPGWDVGIERAVQAVAWGPLVGVFAALDWLEGFKQVALAVAGLAAVAVLNRRGFLLMAWGALSAGAYTLLQLVVHRPRPDASLVHVFRHTSGYAFPSGHLIFFSWFLSYLLLILGRRYLPRAFYLVGWVAAAAIVTLVALGRVYTAEHWPSDVLAGLLLGGGWALLGLSIRRLSDPVLNA